MTVRKGFTLIELLVLLAILAILFSLIFGSVGGCNSGYYKEKNSGVFQCVKTYTLPVGKSSSTKRVDLRSENGSIETMCVDDDSVIGLYNSTAIYAQFEQGKWFNVTYVGIRREGHFELFPVVTSASPISNQAER